MRYAPIVAGFCFSTGAAIVVGVLTQEQHQHAVAYGIAGVLAVAGAVFCVVAVKADKRDRAERDAAEWKAERDAFRKHLRPFCEQIGAMDPEWRYILDLRPSWPGDNADFNRLAGGICNGLYQRGRMTDSESALLHGPFNETVSALYDICDAWGRRLEARPDFAPFMDERWKEWKNEIALLAHVVVRRALEHRKWFTDLPNEGLTRIGVRYCGAIVADGIHEIENPGNDRSGSLRP